MNTAVLLLVILSAAMTVCANLMVRHGLLHAGGLSLKNGTWIQLALRFAAEPTLIVGLLAYAGAAVVWFRVLSIAEVSSTYPVLVGITFVFVTLGGVLLFRESVSLVKVLGICVILAGIILVARA